MVLFFRVLTRLFVLVLAYIFAVCAGLATIAAAIWGWQINYVDFTSQTPEQDIINLFAYSTIGIYAYVSILSAAATPAAVYGLITEGLSWRSLTVHVLGGGAIALYLLLVASNLASQPPQQDIIITLAAGFVAGFIYWLIAGRSAGNWRSKVTL
ncbi:MAG: hypothetical protein ABJN04_14755 [Hyphomicrobiales bacterium]